MMDGIIKAGLARGIHHVTEDTPRFGCVADLLVHRLIIGSGDGQPAGVQQRGDKLTRTRVSIRESAHT